MTQEELATVLGGELRVQPSTIASWEADKSEPNIARLARLADVLHTTIDALAGRTPNPGLPAIFEGNDLKALRDELTRCGRAIGHAEAIVGQLGALPTTPHT